MHAWKCEMLTKFKSQMTKVKVGTLAFPCWGGTATWKVRWLLGGRLWERAGVARGRSVSTCSAIKCGQMQRHNFSKTSSCFALAFLLTTSHSFEQHTNVLSFAAICRSFSNTKLATVMKCPSPCEKGSSECSALLWKPDTGKGNKL